jgi:hypothetical protein
MRDYLAGRTTKFFDCTAIMWARAAHVVPNEFAIPILTVI